MSTGLHAPLPGRGVQLPCTPCRILRATQEMSKSTSISNSHNSQGGGRAQCHKSMNMSSDRPFALQKGIIWNTCHN